MTAFISFFLLLWMVVAISVYNSITVKKNPKVDQNKFENKFFNEMYLLSFGFPFKHFVDDDDRPSDKKTKDMKENLKLAGLTDIFTLRSYMTFKFVIMLAALSGAALTLVLLHYSHYFTGVLLGIETEAFEVTYSNASLIIAFFLIIALLPDMFLKKRVKRQLNENSRHIPVLQMFIILMLRANKTLPEIFYSLSKVNTPHREAFEKGYRIYIRNQKDGMHFFKNHFKDTKFSETFNLLEDMGEYARSECIRILESNLDTLVEERAMIRRRTDSSRLAYSQGSMFLPFAGIILLVAFPLVILGMDFFSKSMVIM